MNGGFAEVVAQHTGAGFVDRRWLRDAVERAVDRGHVLVTGEPGAGKTSLLAGLAVAHPEWARYFVRRDSRTAVEGTDIQSFLLAVGHQLARWRPEIFQPERLAVVVRQRVENVAEGGRVVGVQIEDLTASPFHRTAVLQVEQQLGGVAGVVSGVEIGRANLEPRLLEPDNLAHLALLDPAAALHALDPAARIVILVDALDELAGASVLDWLARGPELPSNVRLVLSSRPHAALAPLRAGRQLIEVPIEPGSREVAADLLAYAATVLSTEPIVTAVAGRGELLDQFHRRVVGRAAGNFLYLAAYARALVEAEPALAERLVGLAGVPAGLSGLYGFFIETARADLQRLGMVEIREPTGPDDRFTDAWLGVGQPILGVLAVAREPLTVAELGALAGIRVWPRVVRAVLGRLRWLLAEGAAGQAGRISLYHSSVGEFLVSVQAHRDYPDCAVDETEWHERIARHYRGGASDWGSLDWSAVDRYGLLHLVEHVTRAGEAVAGRAVELICPGSRRAIVAAFGGDRHFGRWVEVVAERVIAGAEPGSALPTTLYLGVLRRQLRRTGRGLTPAVLGLLARLGRVGQALDQLWALPPSLQQFQSAREIHRQSGVDLREVLVETALTIPADQVSRGYPAQLLPLEEVALEFAADDLPRALRLWAHAQRGQEGDRVWAPDAVYRAAAAAAEPAVARGLVEQLRSGRVGDWLDLAERLDPVAARELLATAVGELDGVLPGERLVGLARLSVLQPERAREHLGRLVAEAESAAEGEYGPQRELAEGLVAAAMVPGLDRGVGYRLLDRLGSLEIGGFVDSAVLRGAGVLGAWGEVDRARGLVERVVAWNSTVWTMRKASGVLAEFDPVAARRLLERARGAVRPTGDPGSMQESRHQGDLGSLAVALAPHDLAAALDLARGMTDVRWSFLADDRWTVLARIAEGQPDCEAEVILAEILRGTGQAPALVDQRSHGPCRWATGAPADSLEWASNIAYQFNHSRDWQWLRERRFHRDPAEVVRAMAPGSRSIGNPHSWGRTVRVLAETIADTNLPRATALVGSLTDPGERAVGLAALFRSAVRYQPIEVAQRAWAAVGEALGRIEPYEWLIPDQDRYGFAYLRPDHRARFEVAMRLMPYEADPALHLLDQSGAHYLAYAFHLSFAAVASAEHAAASRPFPPFQQVHQSTVAMVAPPEGGDPLLTDILRATAAGHERRLAARTGRRPAPPPRIEDPLYAALAELTAGDPGFAVKIRALFGTPRLPAAAGLLAHAATSAYLWPEQLGTPGPIPALLAQLRGLAVEALAATRDCPPATRAVTRLQFALSPPLADLVDPADLHTEALRLDERDPFARGERDEVLTRLFPLLLNTHPALALPQLYRSLTDNWEHAMALLEQAAGTITDTLGPDAAPILHAAIRRGVACASGDGEVPAELDGVA